MKFKKIKNVISILIVMTLLSGCTATYNLDISSNKIYESISVNSIQTEQSEYFIPAYYNSIDENKYDVDVNQKLEKVQYYNYEINNNKVNFDYTFTNIDFSDSNIANTFYSAFIFKQYDHDKDGKKDYYMLSTTDDFSAFNLYNQLTEVTIKIKNEYEVISNNADEIDGNVYIWHMTPNNNSSINMVYNPGVIEDNRSLIEKIIDGEYLNMFTLSILIFIIGFIVYKVFKKHSDSKNKI